MQELANLMVLKHFKQLQYDGYELETIYNVNSEYHEEAMEDVKDNAIEDIKEVLLSMLHSQLDNSSVGNFLYDIVSKNAYNESEKLVDNAIIWIESNYCNL